MIDTRNALRWGATNPLKHREYIVVANAATFEDTGDSRRNLDLIAVERAVNADWPLPALNYREQRRAARLLFEHGEYARVISKRTGVCERTAQRWIDAWRAEVSA